MVGFHLLLKMASVNQSPQMMVFPSNQERQFQGFCVCSQSAVIPLAPDQGICRSLLANAVPPFLFGSAELCSGFRTFGRYSPLRQVCGVQGRISEPCSIASEATLADYELWRLSTRSFEQLVQSLSADLIGPNIVIFGDGPDGAREATFNSVTKYPTVEHAWSGYGVVQAKFLQRPRNSKEDGEWFLHQLKLELAKYRDSERRLRQPQYYVVATNVALTAVHNAGSKDKALQLLEDEKGHGLVDYALWDYDQLRVFLDNNRDVARTFAAGITAGDVLARVMEWFESSEPDFESTLANFLQKELLADLYANLEQAGHATEFQVTLATVFTDLAVSEQRSFDPPSEKKPLPAGFVVELLDVARTRLDPESLGLRSSVRQPELAKSGHYVLVGGPGQGKSTLTQYLCQLFRAALLRNRQVSWEVERALREIQTRCATGGVLLPTVRRFPVRVTLSDFANELAKTRTDSLSLLGYLAARVQKRTGRNVSAQTFRNWLRAYPWLLVLDGLDEVPPSSNRDAVLAAMGDFWVDVSDVNADLLVVATTRPQGYSNEFSPSFYKHKYLLPLSSARALDYADNLVRVRYGDDPDRAAKVYGRLELAAAEESTARLMRTPLQVTIMATLVDKLGQPPQERWSLFREYYKVIYNREVERGIGVHDPPGHRFHSRIGLQHRCDETEWLNCAIARIDLGSS